MRISDWSSDVCSSDLASLGSPGFDDLVWLRPVRPGDTIRARMTCLDKTPSKSRPGIGSARFRTEAFNQNDELVMSFTSIGIMRFRNPPPSQGRSEEHTSELQSLMRISYAVFCLKKKNRKTNTDKQITN